MKLSLGSALVGLAVAHASTIEYSAVTGYFLQDEDSTDASTFDYVSRLSIAAPLRLQHSWATGHHRQLRH